MIEISRKYDLVVKANKSAYFTANKQWIVPGNKVIGSAQGAVNKMISLSGEMKVLLPEIIGLSSTSPDWDKSVARYWNSLSEPIPYIGKTLETGFVYDISDVSKKPFIDAINASLAADNKLKTDEDLKNYIYIRLNQIEEDYKIKVLEANKLAEREKEAVLKSAYDSKWDAIWTIESEHYKVGKPIVIFDYLLWKYCLVYSHVANEPQFADRSENIELYLTSEDAKNHFEKIKMKTKNQAMERYLKIISSKKDVTDVLFALSLGNKVFDLASKLDKEDLDLQLHSMLQEEMDKDPNRFIAVASDKNIAIKGLIEKYIAFNVLKRIQGTNIITDYTDPSKIIGNDLNAAVTFFSNQENVAVISEYETRFKDLNSKLS